MPSTRLKSLALVPVVAAAFTVGCAPDDSAGEDDGDADAGMQDVPGAAAAAPEHYSVEYENDAVRLLRVSYEPGETSALHSHPAHCAVAINGSSWRALPQEGEPGELDLEEGGVVCVEAGAHRMENAGSETAEAILVEFKPGATAGSAQLPDAPDAVSADPDHYTVVHENDVARLLRIQYGPGETSAMHRHPANCAIWINDQPTRMEMPDGEMVENPAQESGAVECGEGGAHLPTNMGEGPLELILVELKGRATWNGAGQGG